MSAIDLRPGMHDNPSIYPTLPAKEPGPKERSVATYVSTEDVWATCWQYVLTHDLTDREGAAFWTGANLILKALNAAEQPTEAGDQ